MLDRTDRGFILLWLMCWLTWCGVHWLVLLQSGSETLPYAGETVQVPRPVRLLFGLAPSGDTLNLRLAIAQTLTIVMIPVSILLRGVVDMPASTLMLVLLGAYCVLLMTTYKVMDMRSREP